MTKDTTAKKMQEMLNAEQEKLLSEINSKIKKKKSFADPDTGNQFLK